ncbi:MAG TPA: acyl carrier protein [Streptosporangiaceae bacterium]|nr:acyl carrier protein [Streptosporangiaceae bacterium]
MSSDLYERVCGIVQRVLQIGPFDPAIDLFALGASSLALLQIAELVNQECAVAIDVTEVFDAPDVDSLARLVVARTGA